MAPISATPCFGGTEGTAAAVEFRERVYNWVARIPQGRVATYGQIARLAGFPRRARQVGQALAHCPEGMSLPWHRVVNAQGRVSVRGGYRHPAAAEQRQQQLLEREGVRFRGERIDLKDYLWGPVVTDDWL